MVDVFVKVNVQGNERHWQAKLLEINPWGIYTDPCLFNWSRDRFEEFEFRYVTEERAKPNWGQYLESSGLVEEPVELTEDQIQEDKLKDHTKDGDTP